MQTLIVLATLFALSLSDLAATTLKLLEKAQAGSFDAANAASQMRAAGASPADVKDYLTKIEEAFLDAKKKTDARDQNASGTADWNLGQVYRETTYKFSFPLENNCRLGQIVTIVYPKASGSFSLAGPETVAVPPHSKIDVPLVMTTAKNDDIPMPPWPLGVNFACIPIKTSISMSHPQAQKVERTAKGAWTYTCEKMSRTYSIYMHMHFRDDDGSNGGGSPKKKPGACAALWETGQFHPDKDHRNAMDCRKELVGYARLMVDESATLRAGNPDPWKWLAPAWTLDDMSLQGLLDLRQHAQRVAAGAQ